MPFDTLKRRKDIRLLQKQKWNGFHNTHITEVKHWGLHLKWWKKFHFLERHHKHEYYTFPIHLQRSAIARRNARPRSNHTSCNSTCTEVLTILHSSPSALSAAAMSAHPSIVAIRWPIFEYSILKSTISSLAQFYHDFEAPRCQRLLEIMAFELSPTLVSPSFPSSILSRGSIVFISVPLVVFVVPSFHGRLYMHTRLFHWPVR